MKKTYVIGIAGGTGSGKTTVAKRIEVILDKAIDFMTKYLKSIF